MPYPYAEAVHQHVLRLVARWAEAELQPDTAALDRLLAGGFVFVAPRGTLISRDRYLYARASGELRHHTFTWMPVGVSVYLDSAVVVGTVAQSTTFRVADASGEFRAILLLVREAPGGWEGWKIASLQFTRMAASGTPATHG